MNNSAIADLSTFDQMQAAQNDRFAESAMSSFQTVKSIHFTDHEVIVNDSPDMFTTPERLKEYQEKTLEKLRGDWRRSKQQLQRLEQEKQKEINTAKVLSIDSPKMKPYTGDTREEKIKTIEGWYKARTASVQDDMAQIEKEGIALKQASEIRLKKLLRAADAADIEAAGDRAKRNYAAYRKARYGH